MTEPVPTAPGPTAPGPTAPASGLVYADVPNRAIAYIIDAILVGILNLIVGTILGGLGFSPGTINPDLTFTINYVGLFIVGLVGLLISAAYFIYTWTSMRATIGMRLLSMQIGNAGDGQALTMNQAVRRYLALSAPAILAQVATPIPLVGLVLSLFALIWAIFLIYTTANSPTKQGWHDHFANSQVVKAARAV
jgi:uncharacterized RDD family membrane protein YckC